MERYDYVVVGGGSAGCIAAAELSADGGSRVLLLEHGDPVDEHPAIARAADYKYGLSNPALMHERWSTIDARWGGRRVFVGSGRGMGGSGSVNAMVYTRGAKVDYDEWPSGWRWGDVVPDFEAIEARLRPHRREPTRFTETCLDAAEQASFRRKEDLNDGDLGGVLGYEWMNYEGDARRSSYFAFLEPALGRANLAVRTNARVERLVLDAEGAVSGVRYEVDGDVREVRVRREVLMCAGALETPRILMLSGIGPSHALRRVGLPAVHDVRGVGENLHDHPNVTLFFHGRERVDCGFPQLYGFHRARPESALPSGQSDTCYVFYPARSSLREAMWRMLPGVALPAELYDIPAFPAALRGGVNLAFKTRALEKLVEHLYGIVVILGKPVSRGSVTVTAADPRAPARIDPGYLSDPADLDTMVRGVALARRIATSPAMTAWGSRELMPGARTRDDAKLGRWVRENVMTTFHFAGTCAMGDAESSVADSRLRVRGVSRLRIADASAIPTTPVAALNAPSMLVGYRAARYAREDASAS